MGHLTSYTPILFLTLGLGGSLHCLGMCGPLVVSMTKSPMENILYQLGRLIGYISIGVIIKTLGAPFLNQSQNKLALIAGILLSLFYVVQGLSFLRVIKERKIHLPAALSSWVTKRMKTTKKPYLLGYFSAFLPCGLLYTTLFSLMVVENSATAFVSLVFFWIGTLPALLFTGAIKAKLMPLLQRVPRMAGTFLVIVGLLTLYTRVSPFVMKDGTKKCPHCHDSK